MKHTSLTWTNIDNDSRYWRCVVEPKLVTTLDTKPWSELNHEEMIQRLREVFKQEEANRNQQIEWCNKRIEQLEARIFALENPDRDKRAYI